MYYSVEQLRTIEARHSTQEDLLMARAGRAAADFIARRFGTARPILCMAGPGNNGGDALVCARLLQSWGHPVEVVMPDAERAMPREGGRAREAWLKEGGAIHAVIPDQRYLAVVDGMFGVGLNRPLEARWQKIVDQVNGLHRPVLALDVPTGVHADTGALLAKPIRAKWTLSFIGPARGLATGAAIDYVGEHHWDALGLALPPALIPCCGDARSEATLARVRDTHKGAFGTVTVMGGADGMVGAALLAGRAALQSGAGKVSIGLLAAVRPALDYDRPELMLHGARELAAAESSVLVAGPGLGQGREAVALLRQLLQHAGVLLLDADALNLIAADNVLAEQVRKRRAATIITPHPSEAARLLGTTTEKVQKDRYTAAHQLSVGLRAIVVLKGAGSVVCDTERLAVNESGSAALANAGQGDVLSGIIGGLLAQGIAPWAAARLGCYLHGAASDKLAAAGHRHVTLAADVVDALSTVMDF